MKNGFAVVALTLCLLACNSVDVKPDPTNGLSSSGTGNGSGGNGGSDAGVTECCNGNTVDGSRLTRQYIVGDDGSRMESPVWYDKTLDLNCSYQALKDGNTYCLPAHLPMNAYFDAACTQPAFMISAPEGTLPCTTFPDYARYDQIDLGVMCGGLITFDIYRVDRADKRNITSVFVKNADNVCEGFNTSNGSIDYTIYGAYKIGSRDKFVKALSGVGF